MTSALDAGEWSTSRPRRAFFPGERIAGTLWTGGWVGPRAGLDTENRGKTSLLPMPGIELRSPGRPVRSQTLLTELPSSYYQHYALSIPLYHVCPLGVAFVVTVPQFRQVSTTKLGSTVWTGRLSVGSVGFRPAVRTDEPYERTVTFADRSMKLL
jgi:hypothetical protein